jgi:flagellar protein FlaG
MSSNISIGRSSGVESIYPLDGAKSKPNGNPSQASLGSGPSHSLVHSTKELKQAEMKGQNFSIGEEQLIKAIERANKALQGINTSFEFSIHEETKEIMVKVLNKDTGKVVREIPSERILDLVAKMWEMSGILVDERR